MITPRRRARQFVVQALYQTQLNQDLPAAEIANDTRVKIHDEFEGKRIDLIRAAERFQDRSPKPSDSEAENHARKIKSKNDKLDTEQHTIETLFTTLFLGATGQASGHMQTIRPLLDRSEDELNPVERAVLLMACHELAAMPQTPYPVIINEAIEITKTYGGTDGYKFVNGILDKLAAQLRPNDPPRN